MCDANFVETAINLVKIHRNATTCGGRATAGAALADIIDLMSDEEFQVFMDKRRELRMTGPTVDGGNYTSSEVHVNRSAE